MSRIHTKRVNEAELKLIAQYFKDCHQSMGHFTDAELVRLVELGDLRKANLFTEDEAAEMAELEAKIKPVDNNYSHIAQLVQDSAAALDRLEAAGIEILFI